jgi:hypothetical protein
MDDTLKRIGQERRQHDVDLRTWQENCENLEASVQLRAKQDEAKKRQQHKLAMAKTDVIDTIPAVTSYE